MKHKDKAELYKTAGPALVWIGIGIHIGKSSHAIEISGFISLAALFCFIMSNSAQTKHKIAALRRSGLYPPEGEGSDSDVKRLRTAGEIDLALRLYREIHHVSLNRAAREVNAM